ncbi:MAG: putative O-methyltransferase [Myxococcota bacterium]|nr:putative O-methyltransferase [Myxococcota bacterium]
MADIDSRAGLTYCSPAILEYVNSLHAPHDAALKWAFEAPASFGLPSIMIGPSEGKMLTLLMKLGQVGKAVEIGALAGYSALRIAQALPADGRLWTLEMNPDSIRAVREALRRAGLEDRVSIVEGVALDKLFSVERDAPFDAVFLDADKHNYWAYARWAHQVLRPGGLLLADNVYYFGNLLADTPEAAAVRRFHEETARNFDSVVIPTPDGMLLGVKR